MDRRVAAPALVLAVAVVAAGLAWTHRSGGQGDALVQRYQAVETVAVPTVYVGPGIERDQH